MQINEIVELTDDTYEERCAETIEPTFGDRLLGTHHLHGIKGLTVFDFLVEATRSARFPLAAILDDTNRRGQRAPGRSAGSPAWQESRRPEPTQAGEL